MAEEYGGKADAIWKGVRSGDGAGGPAAGAARASASRRRRSSPRCWASSSACAPTGWREATAPYGDAGTYLSVADITDAESLGKVRAAKKAMKAKAHAGGVTRRASTSPGRRLYLCTPDRPDLAAFLAACIEGGVDVVQLRDKELEARPLLDRARRRGRRCAATTACPSCSTTGPIWRSRPAPTASTWVRTTRRSRWPGASSDPTPSSACPPTRRRTWRCGGRGRQLHLGRARWRPTPTKPGRPGTGIGYVSLASARSSVPVFVTGGVTPETIPALAAPVSAISWWCAT